MQTYVFISTICGYRCLPDWSLKLVEYFDWLSACLSIRSDISLSICIASFLCLNLYLLVYFSLLQSVSSSATLKTFPPVCWSVCTHVRLPFCLSTSVYFWNDGFWQHCHLFSPFFRTSSNFYGCIFPCSPTPHVFFPFTFHLLLFLSIWNSHSTISQTASMPLSSPDIVVCPPYFCPPLPPHHCLSCCSQAANNATDAVFHLLSES